VNRICHSETFDFFIIFPFFSFLDCLEGKRREIQPDLPIIKLQKAKFAYKLKVINFSSETQKFIFKFMVYKAVL